MRMLRRDIAGLSADRRGRLAFHRTLPDVQAFFAASDVFVLCSRLESYPRVILEAMAHGLPVLAAPVPALSGMPTGGGVARRLA
jgi:glycosyltransferase involved in cell wall biosynthesis